MDHHGFTRCNAGRQEGGSGSGSASDEKGDTEGEEDLPGIQCQAFYPDPHKQVGDRTAHSPHQVGDEK